MRQFGIFAKYWAPGEVKTRLAASIGAEAAARLHGAFVRTLLTRFAETGDSRALAFAPPEKRAEFETVAAGAWRLEPQAAGDLGRRMQTYFEVAFAARAERVVLIGADSPTLPAAIVEDAFEQLESRPVVIGPARDGGYYLIGAAREPPPIFASIAWSQPTVLAETVARLQSARREYVLLPEWYDVDTLEDLVRLNVELSAASDLTGLEELQREVNRALVAEG
jgi:rSAM/selenodomain-associated transferase 1